MKTEKYEVEAGRTFAYRKEPLGIGVTDMLHCAIGIATESGELLDSFKKHIFYGKKLDLVNLKEELGDLMWYISNLAVLTDTSLADLMDANIEKLRIRFPEKFTQELAENRNLEEERKSLEDNLGKI